MVKTCAILQMVTCYLMATLQQQQIKRNIVFGHMGHLPTRGYIVEFTL